MKKYVGILIIVILVGGYLIGNSVYYKDTERNDPVTGGYRLSTGESSPVFMIPRFIAHSLYIAMSLGVLGFLAAFTRIRNFKLFWLITFLLVGVIAYTGYSANMVHGRYVDVVVPLLIIAAMTFKPDRDKGLLLLGFGAVLFSLPMMSMFWIDIINSGSNLYMSTCKVLDNSNLSVMIVAILVLGSFLYLITRTEKENGEWKRVLVVGLLVLFLATNALNFYNVQTISADRYENSNIGRYINDNSLESVVYDSSDKRLCRGTIFCMVNFYNGGFLELGNNTGNYFISDDVLNYNVLAKDCYEEDNVSGEMFLYKTHAN